MQIDKRTPVASENKTKITKYWASQTQKKQNKEYVSCQF